MMVSKLQTTSGGFLRKHREDLLNEESAPVRVKASDKGDTVTVGLISSAMQLVGLETLPLISHSLRKQEGLPASTAACLQQSKYLGKVL